MKCSESNIKMNLLCLLFLLISFCFFVGGRHARQVYMMEGPRGTEELSFYFCENDGSYGPHTTHHKSTTQGWVKVKKCQACGCRGLSMNRHFVAYPAQTDEPDSDDIEQSITGFFCANCDQEVEERWWSQAP